MSMTNEARTGDKTMHGEKTKPAKLSERQRALLSFLAGHAGNHVRPRMPSGFVGVTHDLQGVTYLFGGKKLTDPTIDGLFKRGLIEDNTLAGWRISDKGRAALKEPQA